MNNIQLFSRRPEAAVDFRPDVDPKSPSAQLRRLSAHLQQDTPPAEEITDCPDALNYLREYVYRKTFTGTSHEEFVHLDETDSAAIDWLLAVASAENSNFQTQKRQAQPTNARNATGAKPYRREP